jgi:hypothetical protein
MRLLQAYASRAPGPRRCLIPWLFRLTILLIALKPRRGSASSRNGHTATGTKHKRRYYRLQIRTLPYYPDRVV